MNSRFFTTRRSALSLALLAGAGFATAALAPPMSLLNTTFRDFIQPGTQPLTLTHPISDSQTCAGCHGNFDLVSEPYRPWASSMMAQATRDPIFHAALAVANQDAQDSGELCLRCHTPSGWLGGHSTPADGSALDNASGDFDGVNCHVCHRMVDPVYDANENPPIDDGILQALALPPVHEVHSGQYVIDPEDRRRGPFDLGPGFFWHEWRQSPFHRESLLCATCHDVSNPALSRQPDGTYTVNTVNAPHPTHDKLDEFPLERTFSEWANSSYVFGEIETDGRFGGNETAVSSCQDCHMPKVSGVACMPGLSGVFRDDQPRHEFNGSNSWVLRAVHNLYPGNETGLDNQLVDAAVARNESMLQRAADLHVFEQGTDLVIRVVNMTGHKLPTGYGEGRRMWINLKFFDASDQLLEEHGQYDDSCPSCADLTTTNTRVYEIVHGIDAHMAGLTGLQAGKSFHFVLNNTTIKDNRIPPRGFMNQAFEDAQAGVVDHTYPDMHHWDNLAFTMPPGAVRAEVKLFHQTTSKEYIEFLESENTTDNSGLVAKNMWTLFGKSAPVMMLAVDLSLDGSSCPTPITYGIGKLSALGERPRIGWNGTPSVASGNFEITLENARPNQFGAFFSGPGPQNTPFLGGFLLVASPVRGPVFQTDANGAATMPVTVDAMMVGTVEYFQCYFRDPGAPIPIGFTDAMFVEYCN